MRWEPCEDFGFAAATYPVVASEFGGAQAAPPGSTQPAYGPSIIKYLESKGISWLVWCFDPEWGPTLIGDWQYTLTPSGEFARQIMRGELSLQ